MGILILSNRIRTMALARICDYAHTRTALGISLGPVVEGSKLEMKSTISHSKWRSRHYCGLSLLRDHPGLLLGQKLLAY
jgi:hypothetical protein